MIEKPPGFGTPGTNTSSHWPGKNYYLLDLLVGTRISSLNERFDPVGRKILLSWDEDKIEIYFTLMPGFPFGIESRNKRMSSLTSSIRLSTTSCNVCATISVSSTSKISKC